MADTTSIDDLPTDPSSGNQNNLMIQKTEMNNGMRGGGGMGGMGGMGDSNMMNNQMMPPAQVYSPNVTGGNMMNGGGGMGMQMPQQQQQIQLHKGGGKGFRDLRRGRRASWRVGPPSSR